MQQSPLSPRSLPRSIFIVLSHHLPSPFSVIVFRRRLPTSSPATFLCCHLLLHSSAGFHVLMAKASASSDFQDESDDCAICLGPLSEMPTFTMTCGHRWHLVCIRAQLALSNPDPTRRLLFSGLRCAKCKAISEHYELACIPRYNPILRRQVERLVLRHAQQDYLANHSAVRDRSSPYFGDILTFALAHYAIYLCSACRGPFIKGTATCADADGDVDLPKKQRICPNCAPRPLPTAAHSNSHARSIPVRHPDTQACSQISLHSSAHVWKCRLCCSRATYVYYARVHVCTMCHNRNNLRHHPISTPCPGRPTCTLPLPHGVSRHRNGLDIGSEQILSCTICETGGLIAMRISPPIQHGDRSRNMVFNASGEYGLRGWTELTGLGWRVEQAANLCDGQTSNFISNHNWCVIAQVIDLAKFIRFKTKAFLEVSSYYRGCAGFPSVFRLQVAQLSSQFRELSFIATHGLDTLHHSWEKARHVVKLTDSTRYVVVCIWGKHTLPLAGHFGAKATNVNLRIIHSPLIPTVQAAAHFIPQAFDNINEQDTGPWEAIDAFARRRVPYYKPILRFPMQEEPFLPDPRLRLPRYCSPTFENTIQPHAVPTFDNRMPRDAHNYRGPDPSELLRNLEALRRGSSVFTPQSDRRDHDTCEGTVSNGCPVATTSTTVPPSTSQQRGRPHEGTTGNHPSVTGVSNHTINTKAPKPHATEAQNQTPVGCTIAPDNPIRDDDGHDLELGNDDSDETNLLVNSSGARRLRGWTMLSAGSWNSQSFLAPEIGSGTLYNFVSSHRKCIMAQAVDLSYILSEKPLFISVTARFRATTATSCFFRLQLTVLDQQHFTLKRLDSGPMGANINTWRAARLMSEPVDDAKYLIVTVQSQNDNSGGGIRVRRCAVNVYEGQNGDRSTEALKFDELNDVAFKKTQNVIRDARPTIIPATQGCCLS